MKEGDILSLVRVRFPGEAQAGVFLVGDLPVEYGQRVVAMSVRGMAVGFINSQIYEASYTKDMIRILYIERIATNADLLKYKELYQEQRKAAQVFNKIVQQHALPMHLQDVKFTSQGSKVVFHYTAPTRIDFRDLLKDLSSELKSKIELHQVFDNQPQDSTIGPCGPDLCLFINSLVDNLTQKRQCSEFFCCLEYNDRFYEDKRSRLPKNHALIITHTGEIGKVRHLDLVKEEFEMLTDQGIIKRYVSELYKETLNQKTTPFQKNFDIISDETKVVHGKAERLAKKEREKEIEYENHDELAKAFTEKIWSGFDV